MQQILFFLFALLVGALIPVQAALNAELGRAIKSPVYAALISFVVGMAGLIIYSLITRVDFGLVREARSLPLYYWLGGLIGALYVTAIVVLAPRLGTALTFGLTVGAQMLISIIMDHYGWLGLPEHPMNWVRFLGILLIIAGVVLIRAY